MNGLESFNRNQCAWAIARIHAKGGRLSHANEEWKYLGSKFNNLEEEVFLDQFQIFK